MSNTIQIKRGAEIPAQGVLKPFELGYVTSTGTLVIGGTDEKAYDLKYLKLDTSGLLPRIDVSGNLDVYSSGSVPKIALNCKNTGAKASYGVRASDGACVILSYPPNSQYYEYYYFPTPPATMTANQYQTVLTSRGGTFPGDFTFNGNITANGTIKVDSTSYGTKDPNSAGISGTAGQLYFVITG